jgi:hypothetical protein
MKAAQNVVIAIGRTVLNQTEKAVCLCVNNQKIWFPKNHIEYSLERGKARIPYWMARNKELEPAVVLEAPAPVLVPHVSVSNQLVQQKPAAQKPVMNKLTLLEEFAKLTVEVKLINQKLVEIHKLLNA